MTCGFSGKFCHMCAKEKVVSLQGKSEKGKERGKKGRRRKREGEEGGERAEERK